MDTPLVTFLHYVKRCRPVWTLTWRECAAPSVRSGVPPVQEDDTYYNKQIALDYIEEVGRVHILEHVRRVGEYAASKPSELLTYKAPRFMGIRLDIHTPQWQAIAYFMAVVNAAIRIR